MTSVRETERFSDTQPIHRYEIPTMSDSPAIALVQGDATGIGRNYGKTTGDRRMQVRANIDLLGREGVSVRRVAVGTPQP